MLLNDQNENLDTLANAEVTEKPTQPEPAKVENVTAKPAQESAPKKSDDDMLALYEETFSNYESGQIVEGTVVAVTDKEVMVDIGYKSEGAIQITEFAYNGIPAVGSAIKVFINEIEDGEGKLKLSKRKADFFTNLKHLREVFEKNENVTGILRRRVKGGMIAEVLGLEAFLPGSQIALKPIPNLDQFIGKEVSFKIIKLDEERRNLIVSRRRVLEEELESKRSTLQNRILVGAELDGEVKNITNYGAFVDLGGIDGLLHITDMSWGRINHPSEMLNIGDKVKVKIIGYDEENQKVSLGLKQLVPHPWENIEIKYPEGSKVTGKVVNVTNYGAFIELEPGVEGLVHVSEMSWTKKITNPARIVKIGDTISAIVLAIDKEEHRISLGMKQMEANPWITIDEKYQPGTIVTRKIKSMTNFGIFVEVEDGIDGLIHISDISWTKRIYHPKELYRKNQEIEAVVLAIDKAMHRIALGIKQLHNDPWQELNDKLPLNAEVMGRVSKLIPKGILVDVPIDGELVEGFVPISHLAIPKLDKPEFCFDLDEELPLKVIELDMENRRLILSVKAFFFSRDRHLLDEYVRYHEAKMAERIPEDYQGSEDHMEEDQYPDLPADYDIPLEATVEAPVEPEEVTPIPEETVEEAPVVEELPVAEEAPVVEEVPVDTPEEEKAEEQE